MALEPQEQIRHRDLLADTPADPKPKAPDAKMAKDWRALYAHAEQRFQALYNWRLPYWTTWSEIARYMVPRRYYLFVKPNV